MPNIVQLDPYQVQNISVLKRPNAQQARALLEKCARQVQPILRRRKWKVPQLSEFYPRAGLLGLNIGGGGGETREIKIRLRHHGDAARFLEWHNVMGTMLHEMAHNVISPHNAEFFKLWDELWEELEGLQDRGVEGTGAGFDAQPAGRLGGRGPAPTHNPDPRRLREVAVKAAEERAKKHALMPRGAQRLGGTRTAHLTPAQAAARAAQRRAEANAYCPSGAHGTQNVGYDDDAGEVRVGAGVASLQPQQPAQQPQEHGVGAQHPPAGVAAPSGGSRCGACSCSRDADAPGKQTAGAPAPQTVIDLTEDDSAAAGCLPPPRSRDTWACSACTLVNSLHSSACGACGGACPATGSGEGGGSGRNQPGAATAVRLGLGGTAISTAGVVSPSRSTGSKQQQPGGDSSVHTGLAAGNSRHIPSSSAAGRRGSLHSWCCQFCTLQNAAEVSNCSVCGQWRFSSGAPTASRPTVEQKM